ncbi:MAG: hypothetical protein EOM59_03305 [Clostridia bacterium]|nr:hypothetical protein [Clostridia bacterium]
MQKKERDDAKMRYIYLVFSKTPSRFGRMIRFVSGTRFNHVSLAFDKDLSKLYSFGRRKNNIPLNAGLVKEYPERFSLNKVDFVEVKIHKIPVTKDQYNLGEFRINQMIKDEKYLYNLFSVLFYPVFKGFYTYKAYTCVEFVLHMLKYMGIEISTEKPTYKYLPDEMLSIIDFPVVFEGNLLEYVQSGESDTGTFFDPIITYREHCYATGVSVLILSKLAYRKIRYSHRLSKIYSLIMLP